MKNQPFSHLLFFDGECPLCNRAVRFVVAADRKRLFGYAPLQGETAKSLLSDLNLASFDTLVLLESYGSAKEKRFIEGRGALRILWLLGGKYAWLGWLSFLPPFLFNLAYRFIAKRRYRLFAHSKPLALPPDHLLK